MDKFAFVLIYLAMTKKLNLISLDSIQINFVPYYSNSKTVHIFQLQYDVFQHSSKLDKQNKIINKNPHSKMNRLFNLQKSIISSQSPNNDFSSFSDGLTRGTIQPNQFGHLIYGPNYQSRLEALALIKSHPQLYEHYHLTEASRAHQRQKSAEILIKTHKLVNMTYEKYVADPNKLTLMCSAYVNYDYGYSVKSGVHIYLYSRALANLGTQKHSIYLERASKLQDIGGFALTELTHGSNVKGIQTEAHYDHATKTYTLHTPSKDAMKFWIGAVANLANNAIIWANLYIQGKNLGLHAFVVPLRDKNTHKTLPGVIIGDCGPKTGLNAIDNGFIMFDNYKIPKDCLLDKISGIDDNGKFFSVVQGDEKRFGLHLAALSGGRFMISMNSAVLATTALCIGIRYTFLRKQFSKFPTKKSTEDLLINYPLTKRRMMPLLAQTIVYNAGNFQILRKWDQNYANILNPKNAVIEELHFISSALKPKTSWLTNECVRQSRQMMGGHGFSSYNKMGVLINDNEINSTWQGDNNILLQQTTKILLENMQRVMKGKQIQVTILKFMANPPQLENVEFNEENLMNLEWGKHYMQWRISTKLQEMGMKMMTLKQQKTPLFDIWNKSQPFLGKTIGLMLGDLYYLETMLVKIAQAKHGGNKETLLTATRLWMMRVYLSDEFVDGAVHGVIEEQMMKLSEKLANEALKILDCIGADDQVIGSPFCDTTGRGTQKYMEIIFKQNQKVQRPAWYDMLINREK